MRVTRKLAAAITNSTVATRCSPSTMAMTARANAAIADRCREHANLTASYPPSTLRHHVIDASTVVMERSEHRAHHETNFVRWGRIGGLVTLQRYGRTWFTAIARYRWGRISAAELSRAGRRDHD